MLASARGLLAGWLIALAVPLLFDPHTVAAWAAVGLGNRPRVVLAALEILGAALFAFEAQLVTGLALLMVSFAAAAILHLHHHEIPWWLAVYAILAALLWRLSVSTRRTAASVHEGRARG